MKIITDIEKINIPGKSVVTIGSFDGFHQGHIDIINSLKLKAKEFGLLSVVITFYPHPRSVLAKDFDLKLLTPLDEKKRFLSELSVDYLYIIKFDKEFSKKTYKDFFQQIILNKANAEHLVIGYDHKFGKNRDGDKNKLIEYTKDHGIGMTVVGPKEVDNETVSSTKIRTALLNGNIQIANKMLGRYYLLGGVVVEGAKRGRTLGFPTANLGLKDDNKLIPQNGVYFVKVKLKSFTYFGVANIGLRPTFNNVIEPITEVYILDFDNDIYGENISIEFIRRIRNEKKFGSKEELEKNIKLDVKKTREFIKELNK